MNSGSKNVPTVFFPCSVFIACFHPVEASAWAITVVGIWMKRTHWKTVAATKPATFPTTPHPRATTTDFLVMPQSKISSQRVLYVSKFLFSSQAGNVNRRWVKPERRFEKLSPCSSFTWESVITAILSALRRLSFSHIVWTIPVQNLTGTVFVEDGISYFIGNWFTEIKETTPLFSKCLFPKMPQ